jgi:hypothetical protein
VSPKRLYRELCHYLERNGWTRETAGSGWWIHQAGEYPELMFEGALRQQMERDGIDARDEPA